MAYVDLNTIHNPSTGTAPPATWGDQVRDNFEALAPGNWTSFTPSLTQSGSVTKSVIRAVYRQDGKGVSFQIRLSVSGSGTTNNAIVIGLPVTSAAQNLIVGSGLLFDASGPTQYNGVTAVNASSTTTFQLYRADALATATMGVDPNFALASGDVIVISGTYEAT